MDWFVLLLIVLACARVTHLLADDRLLKTPRDWLIIKSPGNTLPYLFTCTWCVGLWVAIPGAVAAHYWADVDGVASFLMWPVLGYTTVILEALVEGLYGGDDDHEA